MNIKDNQTLESRTNFRPIASYRTRDGRKIIENRLFRSGELAQFNEEDLHFVHSLGLSYIIDFRSEKEIDAKPNPIIKNTKYVNIQAIGGSMNQDEMMIALKKLLESSQSGGFLENVNRNFIRDTTSKKAFRQFIDLAIEADGRPFLWHCTAGKDRTGFAAAILLIILGVPMEQIFEDYLQSNNNRIEENKKILEIIKTMFPNKDEFEYIKESMSVKSSYLQTALDEAENSYGSIENYLEEGLGVTADIRLRLQELYLEQE
ncbi:tyrosine-protein phosphatase [Neobacillus ginsengisoli]|uniref:Protein-tyrosine phosphatase n=1 Tax=Neobacillus ginsengisoli TaxID=904295 RepID=A0ABT9XXM0_9BACI|nr:tyrosine-protein phosphatase [Neobacillus ginsengisoli]MDQ0200316.1 protein-tyrosine phosphatase [Neobacillus ginsengisoli]